MLNKLLTQLRKYSMLQRGDKVICAVSGGADSMALLWAMYLLQDKLAIAVEAAHFNHGLRGRESDRDETFVRDFCQGYGIPLHVQKGSVQPGKKGLEAAARDARYRFLKSLPGKLATAHTANDNAETVLMHLVRGTGLKGLGAIAPINGNLIRPMLTVTRHEVLAFLEQYHIPYVNDSSNATDAFLRNRLRHHVMPLLEQENPQIVQNLSAMAMDLREDEKALAAQVPEARQLSVAQLRNMLPALRSRTLAAFLERAGVREPEREHIALAESLVFSGKPSAKADFPGGVTLCRNYDMFQMAERTKTLQKIQLQCPGVTDLPELGLQITCRPADGSAREKDCFTVLPQGTLWVRSRQEGDTMRLPGGSKSLKKLFIDRKIPASDRMRIPVIADELGVLAVVGIGPNQDRLSRDMTGIEIRFQFFDI